MYIKMQFTGHAKQDERETKRIEGLSSEEVLEELKEMEQELIREMGKDGVTVTQVKIELTEGVPQ